ncbi:hypothetical protein C8F01DRAFT_1077768 [Mycena amicta]|nr:hypothetical protein C8F01DRAFT_1077768 [Mycena amicta]
MLGYFIPFSSLLCGGVTLTTCSIGNCWLTLCLILKYRLTVLCFFNKRVAMGSKDSSNTCIAEAPFLRNCPPPSPFFQGRHDVLSQLNSWFQPTEKKDQKVVLLHGLGGAGKTQIALKFIADSGSRFTDQFKIDASSKETIEAGYKQIAVDKKLGNTADTARTWLKANQDEWLLLFDNTDNHDLHLGDHLPKCSHENILITSRNPGLSVYTGRQKKIIEISNLLLNDAAILLLTRAGLEHEDHCNKTQAVIIAKMLYCFPLAIVQAGAFIANDPPLQQDISEYIHLYQKHKTDLLCQELDESPEDYKVAVYTTWQISFEKLSSRAAQFLQLCSFIHFEGITEGIFKRASTYKIWDGPLNPSLEALRPSLEFLSEFQNIEMEWNTVKFRNLIKELCGYSLMTWQKNAYSIHPLVHQWAQTTMVNTAGQKKLMVVLMGMSAACSVDSIQQIQLLLHLVQLLQGGNFTDTGFEAHFGSVFQAGGIYTAAEALRSNVLTKSSIVLGAEHAYTIEAMADLAVTYRTLGRYAHAQRLEEQVLAKQIRLFGAEHPATSQAMANLAVTYLELGQYPDAQRLEQQVLKQRTRRLGTEHLDTISAMANLADTYRTLGQYTDAQKLGEQVLEQRTRLLGAKHLDTILAMSNLAETYCSLGQYTNAQKFEKQVFQERTTLLGAEHPDTIRAMANLAATYWDLGQYIDARRLQQQVLEQGARLLGAEHPDIIQAAANLAASYQSLGQYTEAQKLKEQVLEQRNRLLGVDHPDTIRAMANLTETYRALGRYKDAEKLGQQVLKQRTILLGAEHPDTIHAMGNLAETYRILGQYPDAQKLGQRVLEQRTRLLGTAHPDTMLAMANLARIYSNLGQYPEAQKLEEQVLAERIKQLGVDHPHTVLARPWTEHRGKAA